MESLKEMISNNLANYPEWEEYNKVVLNFISSHLSKRPDMCIEGCKSLIEGISKLLYFNLNHPNKNIPKWKDFNFQKKLRKAVSALNLPEGYEKEFLEENFNLVIKLGNIRNERGDISHGQIYPKESYSDFYFSKFISLWTEGLCYFLLSQYIMKKSEEESQTYTSAQIKKFNRDLDDRYSELDISYSEALKNQDFPKYELLLEEFYKEGEDDE